MDVLRLSEIASALNGSFNTDCEIYGICLDTRKITPGCLFICIKGERFDAHQFANEALEKGAAAVMINTDIEPDGAYVRVEDTSKALLELAGWYRSRFSLNLVGLTGSVGKTTTKEFTYLVVASKYKSIKTLGNLNNEIGLPQMLFMLDSSVEAAVIEMGMNHFGEISRLTRAAKPTIGLITNIGVSHMENLGSREGILKAKLELLEGLEKGAPLILNGDNDLLKTVKNEDYDIHFYSVDSPSDFRAENISSHGGSTSFTVNYFGSRQDITIPALGIHNVYNALAAFAVGYYLDIPAKQCADALAQYQPEGMRQRSVEVGGITSIEDCYNASPDSMKAAIRTLAETDGNKKIAVLSDMLELGEISAQAHREIGGLVAKSNIDLLLTYGELSRNTADGAVAEGMKNVYHFDSKEELASKLIEECKPGDTVIFKASRGMKLEDVIHIAYDRWEKI
jgi:UDP-N-acetylmuramoyl-tripeptide--D-alanyl-D-alanine ligase